TCMYHARYADRFRFIGSWQPSRWLWLKTRAAQLLRKLPECTVQILVVPGIVGLALGREYFGPALAGEGLLVLAIAFWASFPPEYRIAPEGIACIRPHTYFPQHLFLGGVTLWETMEAELLGPNCLVLRSEHAAFDIVFSQKEKELVLGLAQQHCPNWRGVVPDGG
ncbi:MAG: hypothetical protein ACPLRU_08325, partial [Desulfofundulus sp.]